VTTSVSYRVMIQASFSVRTAYDGREALDAAIC
jgi:hypothetical protein